jgi:hypothetical protein
MALCYFPAILAKGCEEIWLGANHGRGGETWLELGTVLRTVLYFVRSKRSYEHTHLASGVPFCV